MAILVSIFVVLVLSYLLLHLILGILFARASFEVYGLLSHQYQAIDIVREKMKQRGGVRIKKLSSSFLWKLYAFTRGWRGEKRDVVFLNSVITLLEKNKMADLAFVPFFDDDATRHHPYLRGMSVVDFAKYQEENRNIAQLVEKLQKTIKRSFSSSKEGTPPDLSALTEKLRQHPLVSVPCVKRLASGSRPKKRLRGFVSKLSPT